MPWVEKNAHRGYKKLPELHKKVQKIHLYIEKKQLSLQCNYKQFE